MSDAGLGWVRTPAGDLCEQGGHVTRWAGGGGDVLFMSRRSRFEPGQAIRGGIPVIFPWFGDDPEQRGRGPHGFARRVPWRSVETTETPAGTRAVVTLVDDEATRASWPHAFALTLEATFGDMLALALTVANRGDTPFSCETALHTYLTVGDARRVAIRGLERTGYLDKVDGFRRKTEGDAPIVLTGETDRVYLDTAATCLVEDPVRRRVIEIAKDGSRSTIVWNPWETKAARMSDLAADEWTSFVCVESGNVGDAALTIAPGASHTMRVRIAVR
jgi:glucose-6-phosphate 1-epimerase